MISQLIGLILLISGLLFGLGLWAYALSTLVSSIIGRMLCRRAFKVSVPASDLTISSVDLKSVFGSLWPMAWRQGLVTIGAYFIVRGNTLVCSETLGLHETGRYGLTLNILTLVFQVIAVPLMMAWPIIGQLRIKRENREIFKIFMTRAYGGLLAAIISIACLALWGPWALKLIGAKSTLLPTFPLLLFGVVLWLEHHHSMYAGLVLSENKNPFIIPAISSGVLIFVISWWGAKAWGVVGLIATQGAVQLCWNNWWAVARGLRTLK
jgi:O-antigen/teichoic acid export membrane protein